MKKVAHNTEMQKKIGDIFECIQVDPISGDYFIRIPEQIMNEFDWYEDTEVRFSIEGNELILKERTD